MNAASYPCPLPDGSSVAEYALVFDRGADQRLLIIPALFDEGHRTRRLCVDVMRRLDASGIAALLPDLPGTNESQINLAGLALTDWANAISSAANHFRATHVLAVRGGGLLIPPGLPGWRYGPVDGASLLRRMIRARVVSNRESGHEDDAESLLTTAEKGGIELAGYHLGAAMVGQLHAARPDGTLPEIEQELVSGSPLWLRAEPDADAAQADALAAYLTIAIRG